MKCYKQFLFGYLLALSSFVSAEIFEARGYGETAEIAKKDAVSNAIKFSVGEFVVSREALSNEQFEQNIVSHSSAYVKRIEVKSQGKQDEQYIVDVAVDIESQKLLDLLKESQSVKLENALDQDNLSKLLNKFDAEDVYKKSIKDYQDLVNELLIKPFNENKQFIGLKVIEPIKAVETKLDKGSFSFLSDLEQEFDMSILEGNTGETNYLLSLGIELFPEQTIYDSIIRLIDEAIDPNPSEIDGYYRFSPCIISLNEDYREYRECAHENITLDKYKYPYLRDGLQLMYGYYYSNNKS